LTNLVHDVSYLIEKGIFVFVYSGDKDFICNWFGGEAWTNAVKWESKDEFNNQKFESWGPDESYGTYKIVDNFAFVRVYNAGHMVPMDQPAVALYMFDNFLSKWRDI